MSPVRDEVVLPSPCLVVLVGASGSGKTTWAEANFRAEQIVSSDRLRAIVGETEDDLGASQDAFEFGTSPETSSLPMVKMAARTRRVCRGGLDFYRPSGSDSSQSRL